MVLAAALLCRAAPPAGRLIVCGWDELFIADAATGAKSWTWKAADRPELPAAMRTKFRSIDECKPVDGGRKILITASSDGVALIERPGGRVTFWATVVNAHSAELLPRGRIVAAASHRPGAAGDRLILFDAAAPEKELFQTECSWAHGVVWDDARRLLWAISDRDVRAYRLANWETAAPSLAPAGVYPMPDTSGHDLYPVPRTPMLSLTTGRHCWLFDRDRRTFQPHPELADRAGVKCITVNAETGRTVWTLSEGGNWWTDKLRFLHPEGLLTLPGERIYKARWMPAAP